MENMPFFISPPYQVLMMTCSLLVMLKTTAGLGVQAQLLVVLNLGLGGVVDNEVGLKVLQLLSGGLDEHVGDKVCLPGHFHDEADGHAGVLVGAAEGIHDEQALVGQLLLGDVLHGSPGLLESWGGCRSCTRRWSTKRCPWSSRPRRCTCPWGNGRCRCRS